MKKSQSVSLLISTLIFFMLFSCSDDVLDPVNPSAKVIDDISIVQSKVQFGIDRIYNYKIAVESSYLPSDSLRVSAFFTNGMEIIEMNLYDDGISDDSLRNDLVASNNIWSGGINSNSFSDEGNWQLNIDILILDSLVINEHIFTNILVNTNTAPIINSIVGITEGDTLFSGFDTKNLTISITDPDNDAFGNNDNQTLKLEIFHRDYSKDYYFERENPLSDMIISLDSTLASELGTKDNYKFTFIATDLYGESDSLSLGNIRIENTAPIIYDLLFPDTVYVPADTSLYVFYSATINVNDSQGNLESQDIQEVILTTGSDHNMIDDGDESSGVFSSGDLIKNDGIYTVKFKVKGAYFTADTAILPFTIRAYDKVDNESNLIEDEFVFIKETKSKTNRVNDVQKFNYSNPFNIK